MIKIFKALQEKPDLLGDNNCWAQLELVPFKKQKMKKNPHLVLTSAYQLR
jgi:hypothetical protein